MSKTFWYSILIVIIYLFVVKSVQTKTTATKTVTTENKTTAEDGVDNVTEVTENTYGGTIWEEAQKRGYVN